MSGTQPVFNGSLNYDYSRLRYHEGKTPGLADSDMLTGGIALMMLVMTFFSDQAGGVYKAIQERQDLARKGQEMTNVLEEQIASFDTHATQDKSINEKGKNLALDPKVREFFEENNIVINVGNGSQKTVWEYEQRNKGEAPTRYHSRYQLQSLRYMKAAAESFTSRASDFVSQNQLVIQKMMQAYNIAVQLVQSSQSMQAEQNKSIASAIR